MSELTKQDIEDNVQEVLNINYDDLIVRLAVIRKQLSDARHSLRAKVPENLADEELLANQAFKNCLIANTILQMSESDADDNSFNILLYFLYEKCKGSIIDLISQYEIVITKDEEGKFKFDLRIIETEFADE